ncbi:MAG: alpha/beta hydrolase [Clostridia bacterium]|nr:alpha/beta hydrolase [Clostridia bacterium]
MKKGKKALKVIGSVALAVVVGAGIWQIVVRQQSKKYNMITLDTSNVPSPVTSPIKEDDIQLSEVKMHYSVYGEKGHPLILVHGNGGSQNSLKEAATYLANNYTVYVIESRCHGQSSDPGVISYDLMAKDIKDFIEALNLEKPYLMGHSDGGINALTVAFTYPDLLGGFISCGANTTPDTFKPYFTIGVKVNDIFNPNKLNDMMLTQPQMNEELLSKITCPAYIVAGEYDIMWLSDSVLIHESIKDSKIAIIKGGNHSSYISQDGKQAYVLAHDFFNSIEQ